MAEALTDYLGIMWRSLLLPDVWGPTAYSLYPILFLTLIQYIIPEGSHTPFPYPNPGSYPIPTLTRVHTPDEVIAPTLPPLTLDNALGMS